MRRYKHRYELAEAILRSGGTDEQIQRKIMQEFPTSKVNPTRASWYRRSWNKFGHCRGPSKAPPNSPPAKSNARNGCDYSESTPYDVDAVLDRLEREYASRSDLYVAKLVSRLVRNDRGFINALKSKYGFRCQFPGCKAEIPMNRGGLYCEVAHLQPVHRGGAATRINLIVLCPNHHKMIDHGHLSVVSATRHEIVGILNGRRFRIRR